MHNWVLRGGRNGPKNGSELEAVKNVHVSRPARCLVLLKSLEVFFGELEHEIAVDWAGFIC